MQKFLVPIFLICIILLTSCGQEIDNEILDIVMKGTPNNIEVLNDLFESNEYISNSDDTINMPYRIYIPEGDISKKYPLVIFLHGRGEQGNDNLQQITKNTPFDLLVLDEETSTTYQCAAMAPQLSKDYNEWTDKAVINTLVDLVWLISEEKNIDKERIYVIGISMGGTGIFKLLSENSELFAAGIPICGGEKKGTLTSKIRETPIWIFHAIDDPFETIKTPRRIVKTIEEFGGNVKYTEYETGGHMIWGKVYNDPHVFEWLFEQRKENT